MKRKIYKDWPGKNKFLFYGRIMIGPDWYRAVITLLLIMVPSFLLLSTSCIYFMHEQNFTPIISILLLLISTIFYLCRVSTSNPGYIPKQIMPFANLNANKLNEFISSPRPLQISHNGCIIRMKFCKTCHIFRPPRSTHCSTCDLCVEQFDHHCPWIGNCVGKRNYRLFQKFVLSISLLTTVSIIVSCVHFLKIFSEDNWEEEIIPLVVLVYSSLAIIFIDGLLFFHICLLSVNMTTNEKIKNNYPIEVFNPFSRHSVWANVFKILTYKRPVSEFSLKAEVHEYAEDVDANWIHRNFSVNLKLKTPVEN